MCVLSLAVCVAENGIVESRRLFQGPRGKRVVKREVGPLTKKNGTEDKQKEDSLRGGHCLKKKVFVVL